MRDVYKVDAIFISKIYFIHIQKSIYFWGGSSLGSTFVEFCDLFCAKAMSCFRDSSQFDLIKADLHIKAIFNKHMPTHQ